jgi:hypothetical protein
MSANLTNAQFLILNAHPKEPLHKYEGSFSDGNWELRIEYWSDFEAH